MGAGRENSFHIGIYGRCNAGKSSFLNYITDSDIAIVSPQSGTTTDPVRKSYEITGFAPVVWIDTAGLDDDSQLGVMRLARTMETVSQIDLALIVYRNWGKVEEEFARKLLDAGVPYLEIDNSAGFALRGEILENIKRAVPEAARRIPGMFDGKIIVGDVVLLVCPIDSAAPAGRLILPQVQALRELLDGRAVAVTVQPSQVGEVFAMGLRPKLVVTDSQVFQEVGALVPEGTALTSFSILLAAAKGDMAVYEKGLSRVDALADGDRVLIVENCLHHANCEDIGRVKIPAWLKKHTGRELDLTFISGLSPLPIDLSAYALMVQCGGCMVTRSQLQNRIRQAVAAGVDVTNYGMLIKKIRS